MESQLGPLERAAILAAFAAPSRALTRTPGGFVAPSQPAKVFTRRTMNRLDRRRLLVYDDAGIPRLATLTAAGVAEAEAMIAAERQKAGAA